MKADHSVVRFWSTASFGGNADTSPVELTSLGDHLGVCKSTHGRLFTLRCIAESVGGFIADRLVTTLIGIALLVFAVAMTL